VSDRQPYQFFEDLPADQFAALVEDIRANGVRVPIEIDEKGATLDGHQRLRAVKLLADEGVKVDYASQVRLFTSEAEKRLHARTLNLRRRHLTREQMKEHAAAMRADGATLEAVAAAVNVDPETVRRWTHDESTSANAKVEGKDGKKRPATYKPRRSTTVQCKTAKETARAVAAVGKVAEEKLPEGTVDVKRVEKAARKAETATDIELPPPAPDSGIIVEPGQWWTLGTHRLFCGDTSSAEFTERLEACAFAFADPPYNAGKADWDVGFTWAHDYLTDYATTVAVTPGTADLVTFGAKSTMPYQWCMAAWIDNGMTHGALGYANWIPVALFGTGNLYRNAQDIIRLSISVSETGNTMHPTRKPTPLITRLVQLFTADGDTVIDPFLGSGTTLLVADKLGRTCIGGEMSPAYCAEIIGRWEAQSGLTAEVGR
jgi:ParB-like chromosome segregation protein Spo0J